MKNCITIAIVLLCNLSTIMPAATINNGGSGSVVISVPGNVIADSVIVSLSATDALLPVNNAATIGSEILLNSELKGYIEDPGQYFENADAKTESHLDLLMMTQGWRRYECADIIGGSAPQFQFPVEQSQSISGRIEGLFRRPKGKQIALFSPRTLEINYFPLGDSSRFVISGLDFTAGTTFTLEALNKNGEATNVTLHVDKPVMPKVATLAEPRIPYAGNDSAEQSFADSARKILKVPSLLDVQELNEVTVTARKPKKWSNRGNFEPFRGYQSGDEKISHFPTMESMLRSLTVKVMLSQSTGTPEPIAGEYFNGGFVATAVFIDGFLSDQQEMFTLNPQNVNSIEYFRPGDPRVATYTMEALFTGVILITTKYGNEGGRTPLISMENITPLGYQPPVEFYVPKYTGPDDAPPPYRAILYWNPKLQLTPNGDTTIKLEGTKPGQLVNITIQGIAPDGKIIDVTKRIQLP